jgi:two-component system LytT family response regulator
MRYRVLIVDDEPLACERLRALLREEPSVEIVCVCGSGTEAITMLRKTPVDLVFLDMEMPGCSGMEVLAQLPTKDRPIVIFATAHERFAVDAFAAQAVDYLLKPFDQERLSTALRRAEVLIRARQEGETVDRLDNMLAAAASHGKPPERLVVKSEGRVVFFKPDDVIWVEAANVHVIIHLSDGPLTLRESLTTIEKRLGLEKFARVSRSALVHLDQIREIQPVLHGDYVVVLRNGTKVPLSRSLRGHLDECVSHGFSYESKSGRFRSAASCSIRDVGASSGD